ncbi:DHS-like NAD/FAD-binding domain-containing protein [Ramaria rubella]|nr:DHS-like NAD/FAD-binding domain-containing protein [Ramaria rubella]
MTLYIPLDATDAHPNSPSFLVPSQSPAAHLTTVIQTILKAKRIAVVCGAGISVEAGIPDFRSQDGLFQSLKRDNPKESLSSGKDLFDASVFKSTQKTALFYRMIARLSSLSSQGQPTAFHQLLRALDDRGQLLRVYTQNIDALEMKAGLSFGVPEFEEKKLRVKLKGKAKVKARQTGSGAYNARLGGRKGKSYTGVGVNAEVMPPPLNDIESSVSGPSTPPRTTPPSPIRHQLNVIPRCIPLHGTLLTLHCQHCTQSFPLDPPVSPPSPSTEASLHTLLALGTPPPCPSCTSLEQTRALVGKRLRGIGKLRPSVVLYGEEHREGEGVGEAVRRDLCGITDAKATTPEKLDMGTPSKMRVRAGKGPDLLLVVGTSLRVPGTKRIVREFSKAVRPSASPPASRLPTPTPSPPPEQIRTVYLNFEFPLPAREWEGVFDVWIGGDAQMFAKAVAENMRNEELERERKNRLAKEVQEMTKSKVKSKPKNAASGKAGGKRKGDAPKTPERPLKRRKVDGGAQLPPTPVSLPKKDKRGEQAPRRRVILRLPPPPTPLPTPAHTHTRLPLKRKHSIPEVVIMSKPAIFVRKPAPVSRTRSLSPLTSLSSLSSSTSSSLTPLSSSISSATASSSAAVKSWRKDLDTLPTGKGPPEDADSDSDSDVPLSESFPRRDLGAWGSRSWTLSRLK